MAYNIKTTHYEQINIDNDKGTRTEIRTSANVEKTEEVEKCSTNISKAFSHAKKENKTKQQHNNYEKAQNPN